MHVPFSFSRPPLDPPIYTPSFKTVKVMDLRFRVLVSNEMPPILLQRDITPSDWHTFIADGALTWDGEEEEDLTMGRARPQDVMARFVEYWNVEFFRPRHAQAVLCQELSADFPTSPMFAIYLVDLGPHQALIHGDISGDDSAGVVLRFGSVPTGLERIDVFDPPNLGGHGTELMGKTVILTGPHTARVHWGGGGAIFRRESVTLPPHLRQNSSYHNSDTITSISQSSGSLASEQVQPVIAVGPEEGQSIVIEAS